MKVICVNNISIVGNQSVLENLTIGKFYIAEIVTETKYLICNDFGSYIYYRKDENFFLTEKENRKQKLKKIGKFFILKNFS